MKTSYVLIDFENVQVKSLALLKGDNFRVKVFLGPKNAKLPVDLVLAMHNLGKSADYIVLEVSGANALDFHITYYLGKLTAKDPDGHFCIISKDTGFDSLIKHLQSRKISCTRSPSIEQMLGVDAATKTVATSKAAKPQVKQQSTPAAAAKATKQPSSSGTLQTIIENLISRGAARPRKLKTLESSIKSLRLGLSDQQIVDSIEELKSLGKVKVNGLQVAYKL